MLISFKKTKSSKLNSNQFFLHKMLTSESNPELWSQVWIGFCLDHRVSERTSVGKGPGIALVVLEQSGLTPKVGERMTRLRSGHNKGRAGWMHRWGTQSPL